jgi:hypothetical protein
METPVKLQRKEIKKLEAVEDEKRYQLYLFTLILHYSFCLIPANSYTKHSNKSKHVRPTSQVLFSYEILKFETHSCHQIAPDKSGGIFEYRLTKQRTT